MSIDLKTLDELERLSNEATPGKWVVERLHDDYASDGASFFFELTNPESHGLLIQTRENNYIDPDDGKHERMRAKFDSELIAVARNALPDLLTAIHKMREALIRIQSTAGNPDAVEGCRLIISHSRTCLKELGLE